MQARKREHKRYAANVDTMPHVRHGRETDATREKIARPMDATPRRAADWR